LLLRLLSAGMWPYEYTSYHNWMLLSILSPIVFAPFVFLGTLVNRRLS
jgi:hypothetical protein